jgi:hypothetical protein
MQRRQHADEDEMYGCGGRLEGDDSAMDTDEMRTYG